MRILFSIVLLSSVLLAGCALHDLSPADYMKWVRSEESGLHVSKKVGDHIFSLQYKPCEFEALLHLQHKQVSRVQLDSAIAPLKKLQFYTFCINSPDKKDPASSVSANEADYNQRLNYLMFDMQQDFMLVDGKDTLACIFYHYERNFDVSPDNNILLGFEQVDDQKEIQNKTILYDDHLLDTGPVLLTIQANDIKAVPSLKLNN